MKKTLSLLPVLLFIMALTVPGVNAEQLSLDAVRQEVKDRLEELDKMRNQPKFWELGFSVNNPQATEWKASVEDLRSRLENNKDLPVMLRVAPVAMLDLGLEWQRSKGEMTSMAKFDLEQIFEGLDSK